MPERHADDFLDSLGEWEQTFMNRSMERLIPYVKEQGLSMSQVGALFHLQRIRTCAISDIGDELGVTNAAASQLLDRLVQQGLITRTEDPSDRRAKRIELSEKGELVIRGTIKARQSWFTALSAAMNPKERERTIAVMRMLIDKTRKLEGSKP